MAADDLGSVWSSEPVRVAQSIKPVGKELDRERKKRKEEQEELEREADTVELSGASESEESPDQPKSVEVNPSKSNGSLDIPGGTIDVTVR